MFEISLTKQTIYIIRFEPDNFSIIFFNDLIKNITLNFKVKYIINKMSNKIHIASCLEK